MKTRAAIWITAAIVAAPVIAMVAGAGLRTNAPAERQVELAGPIRSFSQDADSISLRLAPSTLHGPQRLTIASATADGAAMTVLLRERQGYVTLKLTPELLNAPSLLVTVVPVDR